MTMGGDIRRQRFDHRLRDRRDVGFRAAAFDSVLKIDVDNAAAEIGMALDILDAFDCRGQEAFEYIRDAPLDILWQQAVVGPDHGSDGDQDIRKDISRCMEYRHGPEYHDQDRQNDEGVRPSQGNVDKLDHAQNYSKVGADESGVLSMEVCNEMYCMSIIRAKHSADREGAVSVFEQECTCRVETVRFSNERAARKCTSQADARTVRSCMHVQRMLENEQVIGSCSWPLNECVGWY